MPHDDIQSTVQYSYGMVREALEEHIGYGPERDAVLDRLAHLFPGGVIGRYSMGDIYAGLREGDIRGRHLDEILANIRKANVGPRDLNGYDPTAPGSEENPLQPGMQNLYSDKQFIKAMRDVGLSDGAVARVVEQLITYQSPYSTLMSRELARSLGVSRPVHAEPTPEESRTDEASVGSTINPDIQDFVNALLGSGLNQDATNEIINNAIEHAKERARWTQMTVRDIQIQDMGKEVKLEVENGAGYRRGLLTDFHVQTCTCDDPIKQAEHPERYFFIIAGKMIQVAMSDVIYVDHNSKEKRDKLDWGTPPYS